MTRDTPPNRRTDGFEYRRPELLETMGTWVAEGKIKYRAYLVEGLENAPSAFLRLLAGRNFAKLWVRLDRGEQVV